MLNPKFKQQWVEALRSGKYEQVRGVLFGKNPNEGCCLGIACLITGYPKSDSLNDQAGYNFLEQFGLAYDYVTRSTLPPKFEGKNVNPEIFIHANDRDNNSFNEIADIIEGLPNE